MTRIQLLRARRRPGRLHWTDIAAYAYLGLGVVLMFGPVVWLVLSSFKTQASLLEFPPSLLPLSQQEVRVQGFPQPLPLFAAVLDNGERRELAQVRRIGLIAQMIDPADPKQQYRVPIAKLSPMRHLSFATSNYTEPLQQFAFTRYLWNSVFVTAIPTLITLLINSMAAYALSIYEFRGKNFAMLMVIGTLMIPITIILVPVYLVVTKLRPRQFALGGHSSRRGDAHGRVPFAPVHADAAARSHRGGAHGQGK